MVLAFYYAELASMKNVWVIFYHWYTYPTIRCMVEGERMFDIYNDDAHRKALCTA